MPKTANIESLVKALGKGSVEAFDKLYRLFRPKVENVAKAVLGDNRQTIKDLTQEIFLKVWEKRSLIAATVRDFDSYLFRMTRNEVLNYVQRHAKDHEQLDGGMQLLSSDDVILSVEGKEAQGQLARLIAEFPPQRKKVFELSRMEHLTYKEIAEKMGISQKTVERHLSLALKDIKNSIN